MLTQAMRSTAGNRGPEQREGVSRRVGRLIVQPNDVGPQLRWIGAVAGRIGVESGRAPHSPQQP